MSAERWLYSWHAVWCWENKMLPRSSAKNIKCNGWPFKYHVFCRVIWALDSGAKGSNERLIHSLGPNSICMSDYASFLNIQMDRARTYNLNTEVIQNLHVWNIPFYDTMLKVPFYEIIKGYKFEVLNLSSWWNHDCICFI